MNSSRVLAAAVLGLLLAATPLVPPAGAAGEAPRPAATKGFDLDAVGEDGLTAEQRMRRRHPQPVRVGDLVGLPLLDWHDRVLGRVIDVVRGPDNRIKLVAPVGGWFGFGTRTVAVPLEAVAIRARQIDVLDIERTEVFALPLWTAGGDRPIDRDSKIAIALGRR